MNALENVTIPRMEGTIKYINRELDELERCVCRVGNGASPKRFLATPLKSAAPHGLSSAKTRGKVKGRYRVWSLSADWGAFIFKKYE